MAGSRKAQTGSVVKPAGVLLLIVLGTIPVVNVLGRAPRQRV
jgi:hypothetical protein